MQIKTPKTVDAATMLKEYQEHLMRQVLDLRSQACQLTAKIRLIDKIIPPELAEQVVEAQKVNKAWTYKNEDELHLEWLNEAGNK